MSKKTMTFGWPKPNFSEVVKTNENFKTNLHNALMYAHYELTPIDLKKEIIKYIKSIDQKHPFLHQIDKIHEKKFSSIGKYVYILNNKGDIENEMLHEILPSIEVIINQDSKKKLIKEEMEDRHTLSIQDRLKEKARFVAGEIEGWIDDFCEDKTQPIKSTEDFLNLYKKYELKAPHIKYIYSSFASKIKELEEVIQNTDKFLVEGYSNFTKPEIKKFYSFHNNLIQSCEMIQVNAKTTRAPKKKKSISNDKIVSKLKYKKDDSTLGLVSVNPTAIVGSKELWCFNTKLRKITKYVADEHIGSMTIKGTTLIGFSETKSITKTLRKPAEQLNEFKKCNKVQLRTFLDNINTLDTTPNGRFNEDIIILKVF